MYGPQPRRRFPGCSDNDLQCRLLLRRLVQRTIPRSHLSPPQSPENATYTAKWLSYNSINLDLTGKIQKTLNSDVELSNQRFTINVKQTGAEVASATATATATATVSATRQRHRLHRLGSVPERRFQADLHSPRHLYLFHRRSRRRPALRHDLRCWLRQWSHHDRQC